MPAPLKFDLQGLTLRAMVVHEIVRGTTRLDPAVLPELSSAEAPQDEMTMDFLTRQLRNGMVEGGYPAAFIAGHPSGTPDLVSSLLDGPLQGTELDAGQTSALLDASRQLATALQMCQEHNSPAGMFAFCRGHLAGSPVLAVMKLESQRGLRLVRGGSTQRRIMTLEVNPDLFVGNKAKLFKAAVFWRTPEGIRVMICDEQTENRPAHPAAQYFVGELLGCTIDDDLSVRTARFFEATSRAADSLLENADDRAQVLSAIRTEIGSNKRTIDPVDFVDSHFPAEHKGSVEAYLRRNKVELTRFGKDTRGVDRRFRRTTYRFSNGSSVVAPEEQVRVIPPGVGFDEDFEGVQLRREGKVSEMLIRGVIDGVTPRS